jgi:hypothetical protein
MKGLRRKVGRLCRMIAVREPNGFRRAIPVQRATHQQLQRYWGEHRSYLERSEGIYGNPWLGFRHWRGKPVVVCRHRNHDVTMARCRDCGMTDSELADVHYEQVSFEVVALGEKYDKLGEASRRLEAEIDRLVPGNVAKLLGQSVDVMVYYDGEVGDSC